MHGTDADGASISTTRPDISYYTCIWGKGRRLFPGLSLEGTRRERDRPESIHLPKDTTLDYSRISRDTSWERGREKKETNISYQIHMMKGTWHDYTLKRLSWSRKPMPMPMPDQTEGAIRGFYFLFLEETGGEGKGTRRKRTYEKEVTPSTCRCPRR